MFVSVLGWLFIFVKKVCHILPKGNIVHLGYRCETCITFFSFSINLTVRGMESQRRKDVRPATLVTYCDDVGAFHVTMDNNKKISPVNLSRAGVSTAQALTRYVRKRQLQFFFKLARSELRYLSKCFQTRREIQNLISHMNENLHD